MGAVTSLLQRGYKTSPKNTPEPSSYLVNQERGRVSKGNSRLFRNWADHGEWVRAAINIRKTQVSQSDWDIVPFDNDKKFDIGLRNAIRERFEVPNAAGDSFRTFIEPVIEDLQVLDAGVIEKERLLRGDIAGLWPADGARIKVSAVWDGNPAEPRYWWVRAPMMETPILNEDLVYMMENPRTYSVVGLSRLETLKQAIDSELTGSEYNRRQVTNAAPDGLLDLGEGARPDQVEAFASYWKAEIAGRGALGFIGGTKNAKFIPFRSTNRDMQFLEWQTYLVRKICAVFALSPQDLGITFDINRATGDVQNEQTEDRGLRPLLDLVQDFLTREVVWDSSFGGKANNLAFRFSSLNLKESLAKANIDKLALAGMPWKTINEARVDSGRAPIGDPADEGNPFNKLMANTPRGLVVLEDLPTASDVIQQNTPPDSSGGKPPAAGAGTGD